ncbi:hypothetical protein ElyMa_000481000 [Elysia marginata]|uniref:Uncharacterized protein n=1 Tax=Elysia marginata TaxID=1093978 RepID=A0AAV4FUG2_9GAST|nr:hypothetical protein ElyMa_000481000 [Elysia marginata]
MRHPEEIVSKLVLWEPLDGIRNRGSEKTTYVDNLQMDTGMKNSLELRFLMEDRVEWKKVVASAGAPTGDLPRMVLLHINVLAGGFMLLNETESPMK